jgi:L-lactate dehydrogenase complex protein LldG
MGVPPVHSRLEPQAHGQDAHATVMDRVRRALGRTAPPESAPVPPPIDEPVTRLVHMDVGLPELFAKRSAEMKMDTEFCIIDELAQKIVAYLQTKNIKRIMLSDTPMFEHVKLMDALKSAGFEAKRWSEITLDESYDFDGAVTDATYAVAETGGLVIKTNAAHGRALTLVPMYHVAVIEPRNFLPDMVDLFEKLGREGAGSYVVMITGPSKTADIEMNVVTGVHGPNVVKTFILR